MREKKFLNPYALLSIRAWQIFLTRSVYKNSNKLKHFCMDILSFCLAFPLSDDLEQSKANCTQGMQFFIIEKELVLFWNICLNTSENNITAGDKQDDIAGNSMRLKFTNYLAIPCGMKFSQVHIFCNLFSTIHNPQFSVKVYSIGEVIHTRNTW